MEAGSMEPGSMEAVPLEAAVSQPEAAVGQPEAESPALSEPPTEGENPAEPAPPPSDAAAPAPPTGSSASAVQAIAPEFIAAYDKFIREQPADQRPVSFKEFVRLRDLVKAYEKFRRERPPDQKPIYFEEFLRLRAHDEMRDSLLHELERFLEPFQISFATDQPLKELLREDFLPNFLTSAGELAERCSAKFAEIIQRCSILADARQTAIDVRAQRVRGAAFRRLDAIVATLADTPVQLQSIDEEILRIVSGLHASDSPSATLGDAIATHLNGAAGIPKLASALMVADQDAARRFTALRRQQKAMLQTKNGAFAKVKDYLSSLGMLPEAMMDYACSKCYGGDVDFAMEHEAVVRVQEKLAPQLALAQETMNALAVATEKQLDQQRERETARFEEHRQAALTRIQELERSQGQSLGHQAMGFGVVCLLAGWLGGDLSNGGDPAIIGLRFFAVVAGVIFIAWGLSSVVSRPPPTGEPPKT